MQPASSRRVVLATLASAAFPRARAQAAPPADVAGDLPGARLQGSGRLTWFGLAVYDARLWVGDGFVAERYAAASFALELEYARALIGARIAERSLKEMRRAGPIDTAQADAWLAQMTRIFPDVQKADRLIGLHRAGSGARFLHNGRPIGEVPDAAFAARFFGIWLGRETSEPALRRALLGAAAERS